MGQAEQRQPGKRYKVVCWHMPDGQIPVSFLKSQDAFFFIYIETYRESSYKWLDEVENLVDMSGKTSQCHSNVWLRDWIIRISFVSVPLAPAPRRIQGHRQIAEVKINLISGAAQCSAKVERLPSMRICTGVKLRNLSHLGLEAQYDRRFYYFYMQKL